MESLNIITYLVALVAMIISLMTLVRLNAAFKIMHEILEVIELGAKAGMSHTHKHIERIHKFLGVEVRRTDVVVELVKKAVKKPE